MRTLVTTSAERRAAKRVNLNLRTRIVYAGQEKGALVIRDLSFTGFKGVTDVPLRGGESFSVALPRIGRVRASLIWRDGEEVAGEFHRAVDVRNCFREGTAQD
jgi:hypothetical protein